MFTKSCTSREQDKPIEEFGAGYRRKDGTAKSISGMRSWELAKCDLGCSNCHRLRTHERRCVTQHQEAV